MKMTTLDRANQAVHVFNGTGNKPNILYIKLKSCNRFDAEAKKRDYNEPGFLANLFGRGKFSFDPQFSIAKLDYDFAEHRNLTELGAFLVKEQADKVRAFVRRSK